MDIDSLQQNTKELAVKNFKERMSCSEAVLSAVISAGLISYPRDIVALATGFGGGIGLAGFNCGALSGAVMAVSGVHGRRNPITGTPDERTQLTYGKIYRIFNSLVQDFQEELGSVDCMELCKNYDFNTKERSEYCAGIVEYATTLAVSYIALGEFYSTKSYGKNMAGLK
ncbi:MAG: hypothetical protein JM58_04170 [Peptococcaceae bacterium BICA1-8]|nr:MAG: hypothetical protein JM58_04170 [Peptococcaceae bacterium BICA1-8]